MNHDDAAYSDPDYDSLGQLIGAEVDYDDYDPILELDWVEDGDDD